MNISRKLNLTRRLCQRYASSFVGQHDVEKTPITAKLWEIRKKQLLKERTESNQSTSAPHQILDKVPADSRVEITYAFSSDLLLKDLYLDTSGNVLIGKLFEDLDSLAGTVAFVHCQDDLAESLPPQLVTASCEAISLRRPIPINTDVVMVGQVGWVGSSSLDVSVEIHVLTPSPAGKPLPVQLHSQSPTLLLSSLFTYVARDRASGKAHIVNRLLTDPAAGKGSMGEHTFRTEREKLAAARKATKNSAPAPSLSAQSTEHAGRVQELLARGRTARDMPALANGDSILMPQTQLENCFICQPQNTNTSGRVFGGFLMHRAYDLAESCAYMFGGRLPALIHCDKVLFQRPVDIGDLVRLRGRVLSSCAKSNRVMLEITAQIVRPASHSSLVSNVFLFVFAYPGKAERSLKAILPQSLEQAQAVVKADARLADIAASTL